MIAQAFGNNRLYREILEITSNYLGPAAQRFIDRQIVSHLHKEPEEVTRKDVKKLAEWSRAALSILTDDKNTINEFEKSLMRLTNEK